jgi:hypothetical protein
MDKYFSVKIDNLNAEEQRIGKVGKNKVNKSVSQQQEANWTKRREALIKTHDHPSTAGCSTLRLVCQYL